MTTISFNGILSVFEIYRDKEKLHCINKLYPLIIPYFLILCWILFQSFVPIKNPIVPVELVNDFNVCSRISVSFTHSIVKFFDVLVYGLVFFTAFCVLNKKQQLTLIKIVAISSTIFAAYGIWAYVTKSTNVLWVYKVSYLKALTGTFINRNSFATYMGISVILNIFLLLKPNHDTSQKIQKRWEEFFRNRSLYLFGIVINSTALLLTYSRWGFVTFLLGLMVFIALYLRDRGVDGFTRLKRQNLIVVLAGGLVFVVLILFYGKALGLDVYWIKKFSLASEHASLRIGTYKTAIDAIKNSLFVGHGAGSFEFVFDLFRSDYLPSTFNYRITYVHNGYLQAVLELGLIFALLIFYCFGYLFYLLLKGVVNRRKDRLYLIAGLSIFIIIMTNSALDFSIQVTAVAIIFCAIMAAFCKQSWSSREDLKKYVVNRYNYVILFIILILSSASFVYYCININFHLKISPYSDTIFKIRAGENIYINDLQRFIQNREKILKTSVKNPIHDLRLNNELSIARYHILNHELFWFGSDKYSDFIKKAIDNALSEISTAPANPYAWMRLTELYLMQESFVEAEKVYHYAMLFGGYNPDVQIWISK